MCIAILSGGQRPPVDLRLPHIGVEQMSCFTRFDDSWRFLHHVAKPPASSWKHNSNLPSGPRLHDVTSFFRPSSIAIWPAAFDRVRLSSMLDSLLGPNIEPQTQCSVVFVCCKANHFREDFQGRAKRKAVSTGPKSRAELLCARPLLWMRACHPVDPPLRSLGVVRDVLLAYSQSL